MNYALKFKHCPVDQRAAITSISTSTFLGRVFTATAERAGNGASNEFP